MIDLDAPADRTGHRSRARITLAVAAAVVVAVTGWTIATARGTEIRFEAGTGSGTAMPITWNVGVEHISREEGGTLGTPWSQTVTAEDLPAPRCRPSGPPTRTR